MAQEGPNFRSTYRRQPLLAAPILPQALKAKICHTIYMQLCPEVETIESCLIKPTFSISCNQVIPYSHILSLKLVKNLMCCRKQATSGIHVNHNVASNEVHIQQSSFFYFSVYFHAFICIPNAATSFQAAYQRDTIWGKTLKLPFFASLMLPQAFKLHINETAFGEKPSSCIFSKQINASSACPWSV